jgi:hypothetical protein
MGGCGETLEDLKTRILTCRPVALSVTVVLEWSGRWESNPHENYKTPFKIR